MEHCRTCPPWSRVVRDEVAHRRWHERQRESGVRLQVSVGLSDVLLIAGVLAWVAADD